MKYNLRSAIEYLNENAAERMKYVEDFWLISDNELRNRTDADIRRDFPGMYILKERINRYESCVIAVWSPCEMRHTLDRLLMHAFEGDIWSTASFDGEIDFLIGSQGRRELLADENRRRDLGMIEYKFGMEVPNG